MTPNDDNTIPAADAGGAETADSESEVPRGMPEGADTETEAAPPLTPLTEPTHDAHATHESAAPTIEAPIATGTDEHESAEPPSPSEVEATVAEGKQRSLLAPPTAGRMFGYALVCGFVGVLISLRGFAAVTLPHILTPDGLNFQGVQEGLPIPRLLDWDPTQISLMQEYVNLHPILLTLGAILLFGLLWACTLRALFPALRLLRPHTPPPPPGETSPTPPDRSAVALDGRMLLRLAWLLILVATPLAALGGLAMSASTRSPKLEIPLQVVWFMAAAIWLRIALRPDGFVARSLFPSEFSARDRRAPSPQSELGFGIVFGLPAFALQKYAMRLPNPEVLRSLHALGLFHIGRWHMLAFHYLLSVGLICAAIGLLLLVFMALPTSPRPSPLPVGFALLCVPLSIWLQRPYTSRSLADAWDITPPIMLATMPYNPRIPMSGVPNGVEAAQALARKTGITQGSRPSSPDRRFLIFAETGAYNGLQHGYTEDGLTADLASVPKVEAYLKSHDYNTALSWTAFKFLYNVGNVHFDNTIALRAGLDELEYAPDNVMTRSVREMLFTTSASPQNLAILNEWADDRRFDPADRATLELLGDLYLRFGEQKRALDWYTRADMPHSFMADIRSHKPLFHSGQIQGTLLWNGKPLAGVQVGAFPYLQNGLPKDLEGTVREAEQQLMPGFTYSESFGPMEPRPFVFRWMSAGTTTDSAGHFNLNYLTEGTYRIVCTLPPDVILKPFQDDRLHLVNAPRGITVRYPKPSKDLGTIELTFHP